MGSPPPLPPPPVAGDTFESLVRGNTSRVRRLVRRARVPEADEKDVIQEVFLALHLAVGRGLTIVSSLGDWLKKITYRIARDRLKLAYNARELLTEEGEIEQQDEGASPEEHMQRIDVRHLVGAVLDDLPPHLRLVLVMSDADEMPMSEIAEVLEIPMGTGYSRLHAARREFARAWSKRCEEQAPHAAAYGLAPFLLFDADKLCDLEREIPEQPGGFEDQVWNRLVEALGPGLSWGGAGPAVGPGAVAAAAKGAAMAAGKSAGLLLTARQIAAVVVASALAGAGLYALIAALRSDPPQATIQNDTLPVAPAFPQPSNASQAPLALPSATATATTIPTADASAPVDRASSERNVLERARTSLARAAIAPTPRIRDLEIAAALAALADHERRFPGALFAHQREALREQIKAYQAERHAQGGGHP
ncbi:MAG: sigma-70 family RNA polymerase sigma factor [Byssovorax sp.]